MKNKKLLAVILSLAILISAGTFALASSDTGTGSIEFESEDQGEDGRRRRPDRDPWENLIADNSDLEFGVVEAKDVNFTYNTKDAVDADDNPIVAPHAGFFVASRAQDWHVTATVGGFTTVSSVPAEHGLPTLQGFTLGLALVEDSNLMVGGVNGVSSWIYTPTAGKISAGSGTIIVASGSNPSRLARMVEYGANYDGILDVIGGTAPEGKAQATITWTYINAPAP